MSEQVNEALREMEERVLYWQERRHTSRLADEYFTDVSTLLAIVRSRGERHRQMEEALQACLESLQHIEREMLPEGEKFAEWSHPANSMRMARKALASSEATNRATEGE